MLPKAPPIALRHLLLAGIVALGGCHGHHHVAVTTYHFDNLRTGWNSHEDRLTHHAVAGPHFGLLYSAVALDDQVDVQPLVVPDVTITAGAHAGPDVTIDFAHLYHKRITIKGMPGFTPSDLPDCLEAAAQGKVIPQIERVLPLSGAVEAHRMVEECEGRGKIVLDPTLG